MSHELPRGWATARISEIAETRSGGTPSTTKPEYWENGDVPWINSGALKDRVINQPSTYITKLGSENSAAKLFPKDTVVIALTGATTGRVGILDFPCSANQSVTGMFPSQAYLPSYLFNFLRSVRPAVLDLAIGSAQPHINKRIVDDFEVPLAPLAEQRRIVAKLETLLGKVDASQQRLAKISVLLKRFRQSVLAAACSGRLTADWREENPNEELSEATRKTLLDALDELRTERRETPDSWVWTILDRVCVKITDGEHLSPPVTERGVPLLSAKDVRDNHLDFSDTKFVTEEFAKKSRARCNPEQGDILVVSRGATIGRTCRVQVADVFCLMGSVLLFKPDSRYVLPQMIEFCFKSASGLAALIATSSSTAQQAIYIKDMRSFALPVPPLPEQQEIVRRVADLFALADQIEARFGKAQSYIDKLTQSLLAKAFQGELVAQNPSDEPAAVLLERLKAAAPVTVHIKRRISTLPRIPRAPKARSIMSKSRHDDDVKEKPYLANLLRASKTPLKAEDLFKRSELSLVDFYKQLAWEVDHNHIRENPKRLEAV